jgi:hypothetical protein
MNQYYQNKSRYQVNLGKSAGLIFFYSLLYYNILDFVSKIKENGTRRALGDKYDFFEKNYKMDFHKNKLIGNLIKDLFEEKHVVRL